MRNPKMQQIHFENVSLADKIKKHEAAMNKDWGGEKIKRQGSQKAVEDKKVTKRAGEQEFKAWSHKGSEVSNYSMLSQRAGEPDQSKVTIVNGNWLQETADFKTLQNEQDKRIETYWKKYLDKK